MAAQQGRGAALAAQLEQTIAEVLVNTGKAIRAQGKNGGRLVGASAEKINDLNIHFNSSLDSFESEILRARATLRLDLELLRAKKSAAAAAAAAASKEQAPAATMDIDSGDLPSAGGDAAGGVKVKIEPASSAAPSVGSTGTAATAAMAPFPAMDVDSPTTAVPPAAPTMAASNSSGSNKSPVFKRESVSSSPQYPVKPTTAPGSVPAAASPSVASKMAAAGKTSASPAASRTAPSPAAAKVPSPILVKSATNSPVVVKASTPQPLAAPTPPGGTPGAIKALSVSSSSSQSATTSPLLAKKAAAAMAAKTTPAAAAKTLTPIPPLVTIPPPPAPPVSTSAATAAPTAPAAAEASNDINMTDFFDLTTPPATDDQANAEVGFTDMHFSLVSGGPEEQQSQANQTPVQPQQVPQVAPPPVEVPPPQAAPIQPAPVAAQTVQIAQPVVQHLDDSEFDVEKFAADAAQNLMTDDSFLPAAGAAGPEAAGLDQRQQQQPGTGAAGASSGEDDDLFGMIDGSIEGLGDDPTTNFDELYMGGNDSIDIDDYFDSA